MRPKTDFVKKKYRKADSMPLILCLRRSAQCPRTVFAGRFSELTLRADSEALFAREHPLFSPIYSELFKIKRCSLIKFPVNFLSDGDGSFKIRLCRVLFREHGQMHTAHRRAEHDPKRPGGIQNTVRRSREADRCASYLQSCRKGSLQGFCE